MTAALAPLNNTHRLLRRLREIMGGDEKTPQERLDEIVTLIATELGADACAVYIQRAGAVLELFAAHGLNMDAIHRSFIKVGKGVVGDVVEKNRPLMLSDIRVHDRFYLDPNLGEDELRSFLGTPLTRGGRVLGALVIQNNFHRLYSHDEVEILQTISMVLAEMIVARNLIQPSELRIGSSDQDTLSTTLKGVSLNGGLARGRAVLHLPHVSIRRLISEDSEKELHRLYEAIAKMRASLQSMFHESELADDTESKEVIETYQLFAQDRGWLNRIQKAIEGGLTAEAAIQKTQTSLRFRISQTRDTYFRDRLWDFEDLTNRLLRLLVGNDNQEPSFSQEGIIVVARSMGPADLLEYDRYGVKGLILEEGLHTAHVSIVARALRIPVISRVPDVLTKVEHGDWVLLNGTKAEAIIQPNEEQLEAFEWQERKYQERRANALLMRERDPITQEGIRISLSLNAGSPADVLALKEANFDGVGLYRSEIPFMMESSFPDIAAQERIYSDVFENALGKKITFRTLDIGGDKMLPYMRKPEDENPILGWRAIRIGLDRPMILRDQVRALLRASRGRPFNLMFPLLTTKHEFLKAKSLALQEINLFKSSAQSTPEVKIGAMVEVPTFAWSLEKILPDLDFVSIGSNDLFQFFYAMDRTNVYLHHRYDPLSVSFLTFLKSIFDKAALAQVPASLCGEMAGNPLDAITLLALGCRSLSVSPHMASQIKRTICSVNLGDFSAYLTYLLEKKEGSLRTYLQAYAKDHGVLLDTY